MQSDIRELGTLALLKMHELDEADLTRVRALGRFIIPKLDKYGDLFYAWLVDIPEYHVLFTSPEILATPALSRSGIGSVFSNATSTMHT